MVCVTKFYALPDVDVIVLDFFKDATLELIEVFPAKEKSVLVYFRKTFKRYSFKLLNIFWTNSSEKEFEKDYDC